MNNNNNIKEYGTFEFENKYCVNCNQRKAIDGDQFQCCNINFMLTLKPYHNYVDIVTLYDNNFKYYVSKDIKQCEHFKQLQLLSKLRNI